MQFITPVILYILHQHLYAFYYTNICTHFITSVFLCILLRQYLYAFYYISIMCILLHQYFYAFYYASIFTHIITPILLQTPAMSLSEQ